jgi:hypothetical protein
MLQLFLSHLNDVLAKGQRRLHILTMDFFRCAFASRPPSSGVGGTSLALAGLVSFNVKWASMMGARWCCTLFFLAAGIITARSSDDTVTSLEACFEVAHIADDVCAKLLNDSAQRLDCFQKTRAAELKCLERSQSEPVQPSVEEGTSNSRSKMAPSTAAPMDHTIPMDHSKDISDKQPGQLGLQSYPSPTTVEKNSPEQHAPPVSPDPASAPRFPANPGDRSNPIATPPKQQPQPSSMTRATGDSLSKDDFLETRRAKPPLEPTESHPLQNSEQRPKANVEGTPSQRTETSAEDKPRPDGCKPIGLTVSGEVFFPMECRELIERYKTISQGVAPSKADEIRRAVVKDSPLGSAEQLEALKGRSISDTKTSTAGAKSTAAAADTTPSVTNSVPTEGKPTALETGPDKAEPGSNAVGTKTGASNADDKFNAVDEKSSADRPVDMASDEHNAVAGMPKNIPLPRPSRRDRVSAQAPNCTHFRSYNARSATYRDFSGKTRPCR